MNSEVDADLEKLGVIPLVTEDVWQKVVQKSHARSHPFIQNTQWQGEVTKVTLVRTHFLPILCAVVILDID